MFPLLSSGEAVRKTSPAYYVDRPTMTTFPGGPIDQQAVYYAPPSGHMVVPNDGRMFNGSSLLRPAPGTFYPQQFHALSNPNYMVRATYPNGAADPFHHLRTFAQPSVHPRGMTTLQRPTLMVTIPPMAASNQTNMTFASPTILHGKMPVDGSMSPSRVKTTLDTDSNAPVSKKARMSSSPSIPAAVGPSIQVSADVGDGLEGDRRLVIDFESFGRLGQSPQTLGKRNWFIPDGLCGTHNAYGEHWKFAVHYTNASTSIPGVVCLLWKITNLNSGQTIERRETPEEAEARNTLGWTIASQVFREALRRRSDQLEATLESENNPTRKANLASLVKGLRPKTFTQGPLVFGLKHRIVQQKAAQMKASTSTASDADPSIAKSGKLGRSSLESRTSCLAATASSSSICTNSTE